MKSISGKNWEEVNISKRLLEKIKLDNNFSSVQSKHIISKLYSSDEIYSIKNKLDLKNPFLNNKDFLSGCLLLKEKIDKNEKILVVGDYDVDGCVSTSLMVNFLNQLKVNVSYYIPDRIKDGYGANKALINKLIKKFIPKLIIFLDCGTNSIDALEYLKNINIKSLIIDHHNVQRNINFSGILINPKKNSTYKNYNYICSAFLTYFFLDVFISTNKLNISLKKNLIYVLLATVADIMPIRGINRLLALEVLKNFDLNKYFILNKLFKIHNVRKKLDLDDLGFLIAPIINSAGRIDNANQIVELFTTKSKVKIVHILKKIYKFNLRRKLIESQYFNNINLDNISNQKGIIFIYEPNIPEGIIGIIAAKLKEYYNKPCIVFTNGKNSIKGSARSTSKFNIGEYINEAIKLNILINGGGHNLAAGVSLVKKNLNIFQKFLDKFYNKKDSVSVNRFNSKISLSAINNDFIEKIDILGPFGNKNSTPIFLIENIKFFNPTILKNKFVSCFIKSNNKMIKAITFHHLNSKINYQILNSKNDFNVLIKIKQNKWNNRKSIQLEIIDIIKSINNT